MWKYASYIQKGVSHVEENTKCQDAVRIREDENGITAALADGLGSLKYSEIAAQTAVDQICRFFAEQGSRELSLSTENGVLQFRSELVQRLRSAITGEADRLGYPVSAMDCTLAFVYLPKGGGRAVSGHLGDGAVCVIRDGGSSVLSDSNSSANGTSALLDRDAVDNLKINTWNLKEKDLCGFLLTSDGLEGEVYLKGSTHLNKAAEAYFNAVAAGEQPEEVFREKVGKLVEGGYFKDDISLAVLSRRNSAVTLEEDPTWLCRCGNRNRLQDTYCRNCGSDFSYLYQHIPFQNYGGKTEFFKAINGNPEKEKAMISAEEPVQPCEPEKKKKPVPFWKRIFPVFLAAVCLLAGAGVGYGVSNAASGAMLDNAYEQMDSLKKDLEGSLTALEQKQTRIGELEAVAPICLEDGSWFWGESLGDQAQGFGILRRGDRYCIGFFEEGSPRGRYWVCDRADPGQPVELCAYEEEIPEETEASEEPTAPRLTNPNSRLIGAEKVEVLKDPEKGPVLMELNRGDSIILTRAGNVTVDGQEWVEIMIGAGTIGWIPAEALEEPVETQAAPESETQPQTIPESETQPPA